MHTVYFSLGTNLGDKEQNILRAIEEIGKRIGPVKNQSGFLVTEPWGFMSKNRFLNAAIKVDTYLSPIDVLHITQSIEKELGRTSKSKKRRYKDRIIDIDILLFYNNDGNDGEDGIHIDTPELTIPHPLMNERDFVLIPLSEIK